jgi:hypothetical protein
MAIQRTKIALNAARFPLVSTKGSRAVFVPGLDSAPRTPKAFMGTEDSADYNMAQALYMENVMPLAEGYRSAALTQSVGALTGDVYFDQAIILRDDKEIPTLFVPGGGANYTYRDGLSTWFTTPSSAIWGTEPSLSSTNTWDNAPVTSATVSGMTFVCYGRVRGLTNDYSIHFWDQTAQNIVAGYSKLANVPFAVGEIDGVSASNGYLVMWSGLEVAWASYDIATDKFDFSSYANGDFTGNGNVIPEDVRGPITAIARLPGGFIIFTTKNAVSATYNAANQVTPWAFKEVANAGGVESVEQLSNVTSLGSIYAYTTTGLQRISLNSAEPAFAEVADFLSGRTIERWDGTDLVRQEYGIDLRSKLTVVGNRYLVISYGAPSIASYEYALVVDLMLQRWGKIKVTHTDAFEFSSRAEDTGLTYTDAAAITYTSMADTPYGDYTGGTEPVTYAPHLLSFLQSDGTVLLANWSYDSRPPTDTGVLVLGRVQLTRGRNTQLNRIELEGPENAVVRIAPSYDGYTLSPLVTTVPVVNELGYLIGGTSIDCKNFNIVVTGTFALSTVIFEGMPSGQN